MRLLPLMMLIVAAPLPGQVVSYEATSFPEMGSGWTRSTFCTPERSLRDGWLHQVVGLGCVPPPDGSDQDVYTRWIPEFVGEDAWFLEYRLQVDGESSELPWGGPAELSAFSQAMDAFDEHF